MSDKPRVRFAPSPTGRLHLGGARTAIYNWAFARATGGTFVLRIDDTDPERSTQENTDQILRSMKWLGLTWDEGPEVGGEHGPYYQTQRADHYQAALQKLIDTGHAYPCFCTPEELEASRAAAKERGDSFQGYQRTCRNLDPAEAQRRIDAGEPHVWRLKVPEDRGTIVVDDAVHGPCVFEASELDDMVLVRSDGTPTYNFATVVDDGEMGITHIIRGDDHLSNTPRQVLVFEALGYPVPTFAHLSMILGPDGKKLSKRHGATSVEEYRDRGYLPEAMVNYLALLGWSLDGETTIVPPEQIGQHFSLDRISKNPSVFDEKKLDWMNGEYLAAMTDERFSRDVLVPLLSAAGLVDADAYDEPGRAAWFDLLSSVLKPRTTHLGDVVDKARFLFEGEHVTMDETSVAKNLAKDGALAVLDAAIAALEALPADAWEPQAIDGALEPLAEQLGIGKRKLFQPIRVAECGNQVSPPLGESMALLGRDVAIARLRNARPLAQVSEA
ncbi:MAG: glutamate--tRNA ligase [Coriobacteriia bacterium]|nr:glutamate--tRNA ligase [Coriobacteriia bacterium]